MAISKRNRRGVAILVLMGLSICFLPRLMASTFAVEAPKVSFKEIKEIDKKLKDQRLYWEKEDQKRKSEKKRKRYNVPPTKFDPNQYELKDWMALGLSEKQARVIVNYAKRGLKSNADLDEIFVMPKELIALIEDSTYYPEGILYTRERDARTEKDKKQLYVPLNTATKEMLEEIPGIGPYFSDKIIAYRERLGGFVEKEQLLDIAKIDFEKYQGIKNYLKLDAVEITKLNINKATVDELKSHPYITYKVANSIVKMREQSGAYEKIEDLTRSKLIDEILLHKLKPYLSL